MVRKQKIIIRNNVRTLSTSERKNFIKAVMGLKAKSYRSDNNDNHESVSVYDHYVIMHTLAMNTMIDGVRNLAHSGPIFLPWHREFLRRFEKDLRKIVPSVTLPYWNWVDDSRYPQKSPIWSEDFLGGNGDPNYTHPSLDFKPSPERGFVVRTGPFKYDPGDPKGWNVVVYDDFGKPIVDRNGNIRREPLLRWFKSAANSSFPSSSQIAALNKISLFDTPDWFVHRSDKNPSFRNVLEGWKPFGLHNAVHSWIGGTMQFAMSPGDPVFFLNHCNVDRLWAEWQNLDNIRSYPKNGSISRPDGSLIKGNNRSDIMFPWNNNNDGNPTVESMLNHRLLGYRYDTEKS
jgi:tyrosinase